MTKLDPYTLKYIFNLASKEWDRAQKDHSRTNQENYKKAFEDLMREIGNELTHL